VVVTLLAILELARLKVVRVLQSPNGETLFITQAAGVTLESARQAALTAGDTNQVPVEEKANEDLEAMSEGTSAERPEEMRAEKHEETLEEKPEEMLEEMLEEKNEQT